MHAPLEPRSGGNCDDCELLFGTSSSRSQWPWRQHFTTQPTRRPGPSTTPHGDRRTLAPSTTHFPTKMRCQRGVPGHPVWVSRGGHRSGISCVPWSRLPFMPLWYRFWMHLWRRWWNSCRTSCSSSTFSGLTLSRLSKCRRSCLTMFLRDVCVATRSWRNSWRKCRRFSTSSSSGSPSRSSTIQFRMVVVEFPEVFKAFSLDMWSRPLTFQLRAVVSRVFKVFPQNRVQLRLLLRLSERISERIVEQIAVSRGFGEGLHDSLPGQSSSSSSHDPARIAEALDEPGEGFFRTFPQIKKSAKLGPHSSRRVHASVSSSTPAPHHRTRLWDWVMIITDQGPYFWDRSTGETRWTNGSWIRAFLVCCGLMAAMCVLGMVRSTRRLTACHVVVGLSL